MINPLKRFFSCPLEFSESEELLQFRFTTLMIMIMLITVFTFSFALLDIFGLDIGGSMQRYVNLFHTVLGIGLFFYLRQSKHNYELALYALLVFSFIAFSLTLIFVPEDGFRFIWFFILIIGIYIVGDVHVGLVTSIASLLVIIAFNFIFELNVSQLTMISILSSLLVVSFFMYAYTKRIDRFQEELIEKNLILEKLATYDSLTGIMNRRLFLEMAEKYLYEADRLQKAFYFLMVDIDHFKSINDQYGHHVGDEVLKRFTARISEEMRKSDLFGRIGGEEFGVIILSDTKDEALTTAERIRLVVENASCVVDAQTIKVTTSIGLVQEREKEGLQSIMKRADEALYRAKDEGRNRIVMDLES